MDENAKKNLIIVIAVLAVIAAAFSIYKSVTPEQGKAGAYYGNPDPNAKSPKQMETETQKAHQGQTAEPAPRADEQGGGAAGGGPAPQ